MKNERKFLWLFLSLVLLLFAVSLFERTPDNDEAILAEHSYWLVKEGTPKGVMYSGMGVGWEDRLYVYHRLFVLTGAALIHSAGLSLGLLRAFMLGITIAFCLVLRQYWHREQNQKSPEGLMLSLIIFFSYSLFITFNFMWRPEVMVMTFGFLGFYFIKAHLTNSSVWHVLSGGFFAGLGALTHLNGVIFIGAGGLLLLAHRRWGHALLFGLAGGLVTLLYFWDIQSTADWEGLRWQFGNDPVLEKKDFVWYAPLVKILNDHRRYFHSPREASFSLLFIVALIAGGKSILKKHRDLILYGGSAGLALAAISHGHTSKYGLLILPYMVLLLVHIYLETDKRWGVRIMQGAFVVFGVIQLYYITDMIRQHVDLSARNSRIAESIPEGSTVYGPATFFFNEVENHRLYTTQAYNLRVNRYYNLTWSKEDYFSFAREMDADYIVIDFQLQNDLIYKTFTEDEVQEGKEWFGYRVIKRGGDYAVLKRS
ncbi:hypothetical protein AB9P05_12190 [Roseivirga sp. BDSF3-8]|uniref:hypothetical protein n=1 Tax=Roseivirga sp. BDSF3-8 TaxID=3241598 RepID=UPI003531CF81